MALSGRDRIRRTRDKQDLPETVVIRKVKRLLLAFPQFSGRLEKVVDGYLSEIPPKLREMI